MSIWKDGASDQWADTSTYEWTDIDIEVYEELVLEDVRLNLAAFCLSLEDAQFEASAYYQSMEDITAELLSIGWGVEDIRSFLHASVLVLEDSGVDLSSIGRAREDALTILQALAWATHDAGTYLEAGSSTVFSDVCAYFEVTDGQAYSNALTWLAAIRQPPAFRSTVAQRLSSIVSMATWTDIEDAMIRLEVASYAAESAGAYLEAIAA